MPICKKCDVEKPKEAFPTRMSFCKRLNKMYGPYLRGECTECASARKLKWSNDNYPRFAKKFHDKYAASIGKKPEEVGRCGPEESKRRRRAKGKIYYRNNTHIFILAATTRRARKGKASPPWLSAIQKAQIMEMYDIAKMRDMQTGIKHHVDHIFPLYHKKFS